MEKLPRDQNDDNACLQIGSWREAYQQLPAAIINCPKCGRESSLAASQIDTFGKVDKVTCPYKDCDFEDTVALVGWNHLIATEEL